MDARRSKLDRSFSASSSESYLAREYTTRDLRSTASSQKRSGATVSVGTRDGALGPNQLLIVYAR
jgi:hypothetical protein